MAPDGNDDTIVVIEVDLQGPMQSGLVPPNYGNVRESKPPGLPASVDVPQIGNEATRRDSKRERLLRLADGRRLIVVLIVLMVGFAFVTIMGLLAFRILTVSDAKDFIGLTIGPLLTLFGFAVGYYFGGDSKH